MKSLCHAPGYHMPGGTVSLQGCVCMGCTRFTRIRSHCIYDPALLYTAVLEKDISCPQFSDILN